VRATRSARTKLARSCSSPVVYRRSTAGDDLCFAAADEVSIARLLLVVARGKAGRRAAAYRVKARRRHGSAELAECSVQSPCASTTIWLCTGVCVVTWAQSRGSLTAGRLHRPAARGEGNCSCGAGDCTTSEGNAGSPARQTAQPKISRDSTSDSAARGSPRASTTRTAGGSRGTPQASPEPSWMSRSATNSTCSLPGYSQSNGYSPA
jgi:hypothetical protein